MMFFNDSLTETKVDWYFVDDTTPFLPYPTPFRSRNWDDLHIGWNELGEVYDSPRQWRNGSPPLMFPDGDVCGTQEQFYEGEPEPLTPTPIYGNGVLPCCMGGLLVWLRPESMIPPQTPGLQCLGYLDSTPNNNDFFKTPGTSLTIVVNGSPLTSFIGCGLIRNGVISHPMHNVSFPTGEVTVFVVGQLSNAGTIVGFNLKGLGPLPFFYVDGATVKYDDGGASISEPWIPDPDILHVWSIRRSATNVEFTDNGVVGFSIGASQTNRIGFNQLANTFTGGISSFPRFALFELLAFNKSLNDSDFLKVQEYLFNKFSV